MQFWILHRQILNLNTTMSNMIALIADDHIPYLKTLTTMNNNANKIIYVEISYKIIV